MKKIVQCTFFATFCRAVQRYTSLNLRTMYLRNIRLVYSHLNTGFHLNAIFESTQ